ncbi:unnamed protein product [Caenorhabditis auriculariae]|uniref:Epidermal growth factor-like domain-containing protein n=1 Tax=Caenorhabditis auriculariae TaxID=2777116 RepID=A0A8S1H2V6_9PELO|nr:unnamed protein product [Caenorhabditis auriculariae]
MVCSNNGHCECNRCVCNAGKTGAFCGSDEEIAETTLAPKEASSESEEDQKVDGEDAAEKTLEENVDKVDKNIVATSGSAVHKLSVALAALVLIFV